MKIVLAYSGGLDTSVLLSWLKETYDAEMIAFCANIGQAEELRGLEAKAKKTGASKIYIADLQAEFARDFIYPMIQAGAIYEGQYFLGTSIARPLIAKGMIAVAKKEKADAIAHGATGKGNDQVRFELTAAALSPDLQVIAPWRDARYRDEFPGRQESVLGETAARHRYRRRGGGTSLRANSPCCVASAGSRAAAGQSFAHNRSTAIAGTPLGASKPVHNSLSASPDVGTCLCCGGDRLRSKGRLGALLSPQGKIALLLGCAPPGLCGIQEALALSSSGTWWLFFSPMSPLPDEEPFSKDRKP